MFTVVAVLSLVATSCGESAEPREGRGNDDVGLESTPIDVGQPEATDTPIGTVPGSTPPSVIVRVGDLPAVDLTAVVPLDESSLHVTGTATGSDGDRLVGVQLVVDPDRPGERTVTAEVQGGEFAMTVGRLSPGLHTLCPAAVEVSGSMIVLDQELNPCGSAVLGPLGVGTTGVANPPTPVAPGDDHPLRDVIRDAGVSVQLGDGSTMWFFGDSFEFDESGQLRYLISNTAAWSAAGEPARTRDAVSDGKPHVFLAPPENWCGASEYSEPLFWPDSAVAVNQPDGTDRVLVFVGKYCVGRGFLDIDQRGLAVVEVVYDPADPPADRPIVGTLLELALAPESAKFGAASVLASDGYIYGYHCGDFRGTWGPCRVARLRPTEAIDNSQWRYWSGSDPAEPSSWVADEDRASAMVMPAAVGREPRPIAAFTVIHDESR